MASVGGAPKTKVELGGIFIAVELNELNGGRVDEF